MSGASDKWLDSWAGEATNWQCDELGHLNMRYYPAKAEEATQFLFIHLGLVNAFRAGAPSTVRTRELTVCYLKESRPGARLFIRSGITRLGETDADLVHVLEHADGTRSATIQERVEHIYRRTGEAFRWPNRLRDAAPAAQVAPNDVGPRGLPDLAVEAPNLARSTATGTSRIGAGVFQSSEANTFGEIRPFNLFGRVSESVGNFREGWPEAYGEGGLYSVGRDPGQEPESRYSGVLLEMRAHLHRPALPGQAYIIRSGLLSAGGSIRNLVHHIHDPASGDNLASLVATSAMFDLRARKLVRPDAAGLGRLRANCLEGLTP